MNIHTCRGGRQPLPLQRNTKCNTWCNTQSHWCYVSHLHNTMGCYDEEECYEVTHQNEIQIPEGLLHESFAHECLKR